MCGYPQMDKHFHERELNIISELKDEYIVDFTTCDKKTVMLAMDRKFICSYGKNSDLDHQIKMRTLLRSNQVSRFYQRIFDTKKLVLRNESIRVKELRKNLEFMEFHTVGDKAKVESIFSGKAGRSSRKIRGGRPRKNTEPYCEIDDMVKSFNKGDQKPEISPVFIPKLKVLDSKISPVPQKFSKIKTIADSKHGGEKDINLNFFTQ